MGRICYISRNYRGINSAGKKARIDYEDFVCSMGGINIGIRRTLYKSMIITFFLNIIGVVKALLSLRKSDYLFLQYPIKKYFKLICRVAKMKGAKTIVFIHDLGYFRRKKLSVEEEIKLLNNADYIIAANESMKKQLVNQGVVSQMGELGIHDFKVQTTPRILNKDFNPNDAIVAYAGVIAPRKNKFLPLLCKEVLSYSLAIYGDKDGLLSFIDNPKILNKGYTPADVFIRDVDADFGLVWDGDSMDGCSGNFGEYLKYNSPHKVSFYLSAALPIIIWNKAALASEVQKEGIGILIDSLSEIPQKINSISPEEYNRLKNNVLRIREEITSGSHIREALTTAIKTLSSSAT